MSATDMPGQAMGETPGIRGARLRDLLRRCSATSDHAERAALLTAVARGLDQAAREVATAETVAALRGQAVMARFMAELERDGWARRLDPTADRQS